MTPDDPRHGTPGQPLESVAGCDCDRCEHARTWRRRTRKRRTQGAYRLADVEPVLAHIAALTDAGWRPSHIARVSGISGAALCAIMQGQRARVYRETADAILGTTPANLRRERTVPAVGTVRRLQALAAIGWNMRDVCERAGLSRGYAAKFMSRGTPRCDGPSAAAIARVYDELHMKPGPSIPSRVRARNRGWHPPMAWDDIDNADEKPKGLVGSRGGNVIDASAVLRRMQGDRTVRLSHAERCELVRQWRKTGRPLTEMTRITGVNKPERYAA